ncbi:MAG: hypothetical protein ACJ739_04525 [Acidimicrobiales bacterium]
MSDPDAQLDPRRVRIGLIMISAVVVVAVVLIAVIDDPFGRAIMVGVAAVAIIRAFLLSRSLRK